DCWSRGPQGGLLVVDANGYIVGPLFTSFSDLATYGNPPVVLLKINQAWVALAISDLSAGFDVSNYQTVTYYFQSNDCTGQAYLFVVPNTPNPNLPPAVTAPAFGVPAIIAPSTQPVIYFAGLPAGTMTLHSYKFPGYNCSDV